MMKKISAAIFLLALFWASLFAPDLSPYRAGMPVILLGFSALLLIFSPQKESRFGGFIMSVVLITAGYASFRMWDSPVVDFARSEMILLIGGVLACWLCIRYFDVKFTRYLMFTIWTILLLHMATSFYQQFADKNYTPFYDVRETTTFISGLYGHYNHLSNYLLGCCFLSLGVAITGDQPKWFKICALIAVIISGVGLYFAQSRGAWLGVGVGVLVVLCCWLINLRRQKKSWAGIALVGFIFMIPFLLLATSYLSKKITDTRGSGDSSRLEIASMAIELIGEKPALGGGSSSFYFDSFAKWNPGELWTGSGDLNYVHNEFLQVAVDYGLIGLFCVLVVLGAFVFKGFVIVSLPAQRNDSDYTGITIGAIAAICAMSVQAFFSFVFHMLPDVLLLGCCLGILAFQLWPLGQKNSSSEKFSKITTLSVTLLLSSVSFLVCWKDAAAWFALNPNLNFSSKNATDYQSRLEKAMFIQPDFRIASELSSSIVNKKDTTFETVEQRIKRFEKGLDLLKTSAARAPKNYKDLINMSLLLDSLSRFDESEKIYQQLIPILDQRENFYGSRFFYARHLLLRAEKTWFARDPEQALLYFTRAKNAFIEADKVGGYNGENATPLKKKVDDSILFLEKAQVKLPKEN
jgi:O-antigen ligase